MRKKSAAHIWVIRFRYFSPIPFGFFLITDDVTRQGGCEENEAGEKKRKEKNVHTINLNLIQIAFAIMASHHT